MLIEKFSFFNFVNWYGTRSLHHVKLVKFQIVRSCTQRQHIQSNIGSTAMVAYYYENAS